MREFAHNDAYQLNGAHMLKRLDNVRIHSYNWQMELCVNYLRSTIIILTRSISFVLPAGRVFIAR